jgi:hypothetical protein
MQPRRNGIVLMECVDILLKRLSTIRGEARGELT